MKTMKADLIKQKLYCTMELREGVNKKIKKNLVVADMSVNGVGGDRLSATKYMCFLLKGE